MALPGLALPGLNPLPSASISAASSITVRPTRRETLAPRSEWRFEVGFHQEYHIKVESGNAELFGIELAPKQNYSFSGCKGAVLSWQGCQLEISGDAESEYAGQETEYAIEWINVYGMIETLRNQTPTEGPRVLVVGPDFMGKSSLVQSLAAWSVRGGRSPLLVNLDPREGVLAPPSSLTAVTLDAHMDAGTGYGIGPMTGPTVSQVRTPLIYHYPYALPTEKPEVYKAAVTRMALSVMNRCEEDVAAKKSGLLIDTPGALNDPKSNYDLIAHIISEFSVNLVLALGSERLASDLTRRFATTKPGDDPVSVLRIAQPGGAIERDAAFMKQLRARQIRQYFFGSTQESLNPHSHTVPFADIDIYRAQQSASSDAPAFGLGGVAAEDDDDDDYDVPYAGKSGAIGGSNSLFEKITPSMAMTGNLVAIKFCHGNSEEREIRDSAVMGFLYVAEVDEVRKKVRFLAPHPQRWGDRALIWSPGWPEVLADLVA